MTLPISTPVTVSLSSTSPVGHGRKSRYWEWLETISPVSQELAWCHSTDGFALRAILESGQFVPRACPVFSQDLLYFFYGRPAYRSTESNSIGCAAREPVVIVMSPELASKGIRLYPFDSGAFAGGRYNKWMHEGMERSDFELPPNNKAPERHVAAMFRDNARYMSATAVKPEIIPPGDFEVDSLNRVLTDGDTSSADDRRCAVELQVEQPIKLDENTVLAIILPSSLKDAVWLQEFQRKTNDKVDLLFYTSNVLKQSKEFQALLEELVQQLQRERGLL